MLVTRCNPFTGRSLTLDLPVSEEQIWAWQQGRPAQDVFRDLSADQREFIISGIPPGQWDATLATAVPEGSFTRDGKFLVAEASDLGWPPGGWPQTVKFDDNRVFELIEEMFIEMGGDQEFAGSIYRQMDGENLLKIFND